MIDKDNDEANLHALRLKKIRRKIEILILLLVCFSCLFYYYAFRIKNSVSIWWIIAITIFLTALGIVISRIIIKYDSRLIRNFEGSLNYYNPLTKLPSRIVFNDRLGQAINGARHTKNFVGIMVLDIDMFRTVNDSLGRSSGDELVKELSERLLLCAGDENTVGHLRDDEFAFVFPKVTKIHDLASISNEIMQYIAKPFTIENQDIYITGSIGISIYPIDGNDVQSLVTNAYEAVSKAKSQGRNSYQFYTTELASMVVEYTAMKNGIIKALQRGEFVIHYLPKVDLADGKIKGAEALIRWKHPSLGLIIPGKFLSTAEETGLMFEIGEWVIREVCNQLLKWKNEVMPPLKLSINISKSQFDDDKFIRSLKRILNETDIPPQCIELDLTEDVFINYEAAVNRIEELKNIGVGIALDDFGTGSLSLKNLLTLPIDTVKIDKTFIKAISKSDDKNAMAVSIISISRSLKADVIAIGVEDENQLVLLKNNGCDYIQGYYFSEPIPEESFTELVKNGWCLKDNIVCSSN
jgi:diguanylate cyclase (GGDEF)-like protein